MAIVKTVLIGLTAAIMTVLVHGQSGILDQKCMACLCEASTSCTTKPVCEDPAITGGIFCGPFHMSREYWIDAGRPIIKGDLKTSRDAFKNCALDLHCSATAVRNYFKRYAFNGRISPDCNGDGEVDCVDFAHIHKLGLNGCRRASFTETNFYKRFASCWKVVTEAKKF
nr:lysozyme-like isoform X3 [Procambarus clarkii]